INASTERHCLHISSDACRLAIIWKYGGIYMDTDVISIRPIPEENFLAAQSSRYSSNGVFGFLPRHPFLWECVENFLEHYNSDIWGNQGPNLMTRMLKLWCKLRDFQEVSDLGCQNLSFLHPHRFYPISYPQWRRYYEVWDPEPSFNYSYALHLWNYMNRNKKIVVRGSNTLVENLYCKHCPRTYRYLIQCPEGLVTDMPGPGPLSAPLPAAVALGAPTPGGQPRASPAHTVLHNHSLGLQCIDWRHISTLDVDRVAREVDVAILQELLNGVTFCNLDLEVCSHCGQPVDPALLKVLRLTQFIIEYLLHCQDCLSASVVQLEARLQASLEQQECGQQELARQADELKGVRQESHRPRKLIDTLQQLLLHTGAYSYHPVRNLCRVRRGESPGLGHQAS
ncbi:Alpha-1,4-N-Acetylglucosaminyltransferase, partial [Manis pentadactyla]